jgi:hypothetical protein
VLALLAAVALAAPSGLVTIAPSAAPSIKPGQTIPLAVGVHNTGSSAVDGVVVNIKVAGGLILPREFTNCRYYQDGFLGGAWCSLSQRVGAGSRYALSGFHITASATAQRLSPVAFDWYPASWAKRQGGIVALSPGGAAGSGGPLGLVPTQLAGPATGSVYLRLLTSTDTPRPSRSPAAGASRASGASPVWSRSVRAAPGVSRLAGDEAGSGGGANLILLVAGLLLLVGGAVAVVFVRRRSSYTGRHSQPGARS